MKRLTDNYEKYISRFPEGYFGKRKSYPINTGVVYEKLGYYEDLEERLCAIYGECDGLLEKLVEHLEKHYGIDLPDPIFKVRLLTDSEVDRWEEYKTLEEQGKLLKLPCKTVWFICDRKTKYATVMSKSIRDLSISEIEGIDNQGYYWSTRDKALVELGKMSE